MTNKSRKIELDKNYIPLPTIQGDEIYPNGIFNFNISRILEHIMAGKLEGTDKGTGTCLVTTEPDKSLSPCLLLKW